jgi:hypothetical protein
MAPAPEVETEEEAEKRQRTLSDLPQFTQVITI